ncbi:MAG: aminomethyl-transferring glycine dehydrogenase subunit GcvPB [Pyramidobacter porci]|uniref:aminomethyl-transferring glycine dehydrogenase subunit GcvPB n=1 Tax=Pyramidobacter porci TaxID=2605789 RepID=UPI002A763727|nr:aminomethyl-transferring glycine dehydrogenase subunit GcvPB [Pyramidobacter porci]MDY2649332.1 aminomethyl-transferring glycine dehydrogenase subunit GcvPB [Pyramidobacter porci]
MLVGGKRNFHEARWDEPIIMEMGESGARAVLLDPIEDEAARCSNAAVPEGYARTEAPKLPELGQMQVLRHYLRLAQETIGADLNIDIGLGTCTMKYNPKINESFVRNPKFAELHPYQPESTVQGILKIMYETEQYLKEISGMDRFSLNPAGGSQAIFSNVSVIRAYHKSRGEDATRNEIITTILSHPANAGVASTLGYKVITLYPDENGIPDIEALKAAVCERTAGLLITNPEDTGIYNEQIREFVKIVHDTGGLCAYDQANLNGLMGITRARDAGFDLCHFNLHKTFGSPHGSQGPAAGAQGCTEALAKFLPVPTVEFDGRRYYLNDTRPESIGKIRKFYGVPAVVLRAYAYIRALGADGLKQVSEFAILNNNYLLKKLESVKGLSLPFAPGKRRLEQARLSWEKLCNDTGVTTDDIARRIVDFGFQDYFSSHHPMVVPEPFTPEACETYSREDIDEYARTLDAISKEAYANANVVKAAPHNAALSTQIVADDLENISRFACTWRAFKKKSAQTGGDHLA